MRLRQESEYGLNGLVALAQEGSGAVRSLDEIAARHGLPKSFLAKIFLKFVHHGLLRSYRGAVRGYALARSPKEITLREILESIEGPDLFEQCPFWSSRCSDRNPCPLHQEWSAIRPRLIEVVERTTLEDFTRGQAEQIPLRRQHRNVRRPREG
jgi:Rrf2 family protein